MRGGFTGLSIFMVMIYGSKNIKTKEQREKEHEAKPEVNQAQLLEFSASGVT